MENSKFNSNLSKIPVKNRDLSTSVIQEGATLFPNKNSEKIKILSKNGNNSSKIPVSRMAKRPLVSNNNKKSCYQEKHEECVKMPKPKNLKTSSELFHIQKYPHRENVNKSAKVIQNNNNTQVETIATKRPLQSSNNNINNRNPIYNVDQGSNKLLSLLHLQKFPVVNLSLFLSNYYTKNFLKLF